MSPKKARHGNKARYVDGKPGHNSLLQFEWLDGLPWGIAWANMNLFLAESLRQQYDVKNIVKLECRAIPETEDEYSMIATVLGKDPVELYPIRETLKATKRQGKETLKNEIITFVATDVTGKDSDLDDEAKHIVDGFNELTLQRRIAFWGKHIAAHFR